MASKMVGCGRKDGAGSSAKASKALERAGTVALAGTAGVLRTTFVMEVIPLGPLVGHCAWALGHESQAPAGGPPGAATP